MPYIKKDARKELDQNNCYFGHQTARRRPEIPGELNYVLTQTINTYIRDNLEKSCFAKLNYDALNEVIGVLECVKQEFYRRAIVPYEKDKAFQNGDLEWPA